MTATARAWLAGWVGAAGLGVANGIAREAILAERVDEAAAHRISTATLLSALALYTALLQRLWPLRSRRTAGWIGVSWTALTELFEFGLGRLVAKRSWREMAGDYDIRRGRLWPLIPLFMLLAPSGWARSAWPGGS